MMRCRFLILLGLGVFLAGALPRQADAQAAQGVKWLTMLGRSGAASKAIAELIEAGGPAAKAALSKLGIAVRTQAEAVTQLKALTAEQKAALLLHDNTLGAKYLAQFASKPDELKMQMGLYNTLRANGAHRGLIHGDTAADTTTLFSINARSGNIVEPSKRLFQGELGTGRITLERPLVICSSRFCNLKLQEFNAYGVGGAATAAGATCLTKECFDSLNRFLETTKTEAAPAPAPTPAPAPPPTARGSDSTK